MMRNHRPTVVTNYCDTVEPGVGGCSVSASADSLCEFGVQIHFSLNEIADPYPHFFGDFFANMW